MATLKYYDSTSGTWKIAAASSTGAGVTDGNKGDVTVSGTGSVWSLNGKPTGSIVGTTDTQTLTNKTLTAPVLGGSVTGTYTLAGTPTFPATVVLTSGAQTLASKTLTSPVINTGTVGADPSAALGIASKQYVDNKATTSMVTGETPVGLVNGSNTAYTTASGFATGSLRVFLNGQRLSAGGADYTEGSQAFTMAYAPATGDVLTVDYNITNSAFIQGNNSIIVQETPTGSVNGSNTSFTTLQGKYVANSLEVFVNGLQQTKTTDYAETTPASGIFTFTTAPLTGDILRVNYQFSTGASGNADTVDGIHASATPAASQLVALNSSSKYPQTVLPTGSQIRLGLNQKTSSGTVLGTTFNTYCTVTATSNGGECEATFTLYLYNGNSGANRTATVKVQCDGVDISPAAIPVQLPTITGANTPNTASFVVSSTPSSGSHTWTLQALGSAASSVVLDYGFLKITEIVA